MSLMWIPAKRPDPLFAQSRRQRDVTPILAKGKRIFRIGDGTLGQAPIARVSGEQRTIAEIFAVLHAIGANTARVSEPRDAYPLVDTQPVDTETDRIDAADNLVAGNDRYSDVR